MISIFQEFFANYGMELIYLFVTAIAGYIGILVKNLYQKYVNDTTKKAVVKTCVQAVEQLYKDLNGEDKYNKVVEAASEMLTEKGITVTDLEIRMLIEAAVGEFNEVFKKNTVDTPELTE